MTESKMIAQSILRACDDGSSYSKVAAWDKDEAGNLCIVNSKYATSITPGAANLQMVSNRANAAAYCVNGETYTIDTTLNGKDVRQTENHQISNGLVAQTQFALENSGSAGGQAFIATGVPIRQFFGGPDSNIDHEYIKKKSSVFTEAVIKNKADEKGHITEVDKNLLVDVIGNVVLPEAIGAYYDIAYDNNGQITDIAKGWDGDVLIIDMGSVTTDITIIGPGGNIRKESIETMEDRGFLRLYDMLERRLIEQKYAVRSLPKSMAEMAFTTGKIRLIAGEVDVQKECDYVLEEGMEPIIERIKQVAGDRIQMLSAIIAVGGGANSIKDHFGELSKYVITPENPQFSNANGFLKLLTYFAGEKTGPIMADVLA